MPEKMFVHWFVRREHRGVVCIVTSDRYDSALSFIEALYGEARRAIPKLKRKDVELRFYDNGRWGLEFYSLTIPEGYEEIHILPKIK